MLHYCQNSRKSTETHHLITNVFIALPLFKFSAIYLSTLYLKIMPSKRFCDQESSFYFIEFLLSLVSQVSGDGSRVLQGCSIKVGQHGWPTKKKLGFTLYKMCLNCISRPILQANGICNGKDYTKKSLIF